MVRWGGFVSKALPSKKQSNNGSLTNKSLSKCGHRFHNVNEGVYLSLYMIWSIYHPGQNQCLSISSHLRWHTWTSFLWPGLSFSGILKLSVDHSVALTTPLKWSSISPKKMPNRDCHHSGKVFNLFILLKRTPQNFIRFIEPDKYCPRQSFYIKKQSKMGYLLFVTFIAANRLNTNDIK